MLRRMVDLLCHPTRDVAAHGPDGVASFDERQIVHEPESPVLGVLVIEHFAGEHPLADRHDVREVIMHPAEPAPGLFQVGFDVA